MASSLRTTTTILLHRVSQSAFSTFSSKRFCLAFLRNSPYTAYRGITNGSFRCAAASEYGEISRKASARLSQVQQLLLEAEERSSSAVNEPPPPKIGLGKSPNLFLIQFAIHFVSLYINIYNLGCCELKEWSLIGIWMRFSLYKNKM